MTTHSFSSVKCSFTSSVQFFRDMYPSLNDFQNSLHGRAFNTLYGQQVASLPFTFFCYYNYFVVHI